VNFKPCRQSAEIAAAVRDGYWPMACDPRLRVHVRDCPSCSELLLVTEALRRDRAEAVASAPLPSPTLLWWRARLLRHQQAIRQVSKPITLAGQVSVGVMLMSAVGLVSWEPSPMRDWLWLCTQFLNTWGADNGGSHAAGLFPFALWIVGPAVLALFGGYALYLICQPE
jgi:hypothetical protein